jgi:predicted chitinase
MDIATFTSAMPGLSESKARAYLGPMEAAMREYQITSEMRSAMWLAQVGHESVSLVYFEEIASGAAYEGRRDLGNTQPGDGVRFKGRGPIQLTGRSNYANAGNALHLPLVSNPPMAADPRYAFRISAWWWGNHGLNSYADRGDVLGATRVINGGTNGLDNRRSRYNHIRTLGARVRVGSGVNVPPLHVDFLGRSHNRNHPDVRVWQAQMARRGWDVGKLDGAFGDKCYAACRGFQRNQKVATDGRVGPTTWDLTWTGQGGGSTKPMP